MSLKHCWQNQKAKKILFMNVNRDINIFQIIHCVQ